MSQVESRRVVEGSDGVPESVSIDMVPVKDHDQDVWGMARVGNIALLYLAMFALGAIGGLLYMLLRQFMD